MKHHPSVPTARPGRERMSIEVERSGPMREDLQSAHLLRTIAATLGVTPDVFLSPGRPAARTGGDGDEPETGGAYRAGAARLLQLYRDMPDQRCRDQALRMVEDLFSSETK